MENNVIQLDSYKIKTKKELLQLLDKVQTQNDIQLEQNFQKNEYKYYHMEIKKLILNELCHLDDYIHKEKNSRFAIFYLSSLKDSDDKNIIHNLYRQKFPWYINFLINLPFGSCIKGETFMELDERRNIIDNILSEIISENKLDFKLYCRGQVENNVANYYVIVDLN